MSDINILEKRIKELEKENEELKLQLNKRKKVGRKQRFQEHEIEAMRFYRFQGKTFKEISELFNCSVGLVHNKINQNREMCKK